MNIVYNEDCFPAMQKFPDKYFDLAVVDPLDAAPRAAEGRCGVMNNISETELNKIMSEKSICECVPSAESVVVIFSSVCRGMEKREIASRVLIAGMKQRLTA